MVCWFVKITKALHSITAFKHFAEVTVPQYHIVDGNVNDAFGVETLTGRVFVMSEILWEEGEVSDIWLLHKFHWEVLNSVTFASNGCLWQLR